MSADSTIAIEILGPVVPWQRTATVAGRRVTPKRQREYQAKVQWVALAARGPGWPLDARYRVQIWVWGSRRFDLDNAGKTILDALTGIAWADDRQVDELLVVRHHARGRDSRVRARIERLA